MNRCRALAAMGILAIPMVQAALLPALQAQQAKLQVPTVNDDGTVILPDVTVPYSDLASPQAKKNFIDFVRGFESLSTPPKDWVEKPNETATQRSRRLLDEKLMIPWLNRVRAAFSVDIEPQTIGGVQTDVVVPKDGISPANKNRILINLHGGGMQVGARYGGQMESVPIASLGHIKVVTVDYRMAPEWQFPAASEDVAKVYRELLKSYRSENIGIYGCSAGASLTAQALAWFQKHDLPRPGAIGLFGFGADTSNHWGDGNYISSPLMGWRMPFSTPARSQVDTGYLRGADRNDPLVNPAKSDTVLSAFPPSLLISGTRDVSLSKVLHSHQRLVDLGVQADLHVFEGAPHCSFAQPVVDPEVPENRQAWKVINQFFDKHLGTKTR